MVKKIPHINLNDYFSDDEQVKQNFVKTLGDGLKEFGFLTVGDHGLKEAVIKQAYQGFRDFFALDTETKNKYDCVPGGARGYTPFGREHAKDSDEPDLKEFWHVGQVLPEGHYLQEKYHPNVWPEEVVGIEAATMALYRGLESCADTILKALAEYFELPVDTFANMAIHGNSILRPIHYPPLEEGRSPKAIRAAAHEDINLITLLIESDGAGLEIFTQDQEWIPVSALEGDIVVDSGDMLSRVTNGLIPATTHRVVNPPQTENKARYSMPFFVHPFSDCDLSVLEQFTSQENPAKWEPITADEFLTQRLIEIGLIKE